MKFGLSALIMLKFGFKENELFGFKKVSLKSKMSTSFKIDRISFFLFVIPRQFYCSIFRLMSWSILRVGDEGRKVRSEIVNKII